jgi:nucleoside-diphosphate-sugar epimerase
MHALVTGTAGFIASHVANLLLDHGATVHGVDAFTDYYPRRLKDANLATLTGRPGFTFTEGRLEDVDLGPVLDGVTHVFHFAAQAGVRRSWGKDFRHYTVNNIEVTQRLLEAVAPRKIERFLYASTSSVYGDLAPIPMREDVRVQPVSPYGVTKLAGEQLCFLYHVNHGVPTVALRLFTVYGPRQRPDMGFHRFLRAAHEGGSITLYGDGEQTRDFTYVADVAEAARLGAVQGVPGRVYNIGGGSRVSVNQVLKLVEEIVGCPVTIDRQPPQPGDMRDTFADTSLARADLGFEPKTSLAEGLAAEYAWLKPSLWPPSPVNTTR